MREITEKLQKDVADYLRRHDLTQKELAEKVGLSPRHFSRLMQPKSVGCSIQNTNATVLLGIIYESRGNSPPELHEPGTPYSLEAEPYSPAGMKPIPLLGLAQAKSFGDDWRDWLNSNQDYETILVEDQGREVISFRVTGDSMAPVVHSGDILIVDPNDKLGKDRLSFFVCNEGVFVKWFDREENGMLHFSSENAGGLNLSVPRSGIIFAASVMEVRRIAPRRQSSNCLEDLSRTNKLKRGSDL